MSDFVEREFSDLSMISDTLDRRATTVCLEVVPKVSPDDFPPGAAPYGVKFDRGDDATWFSASVHRLSLVVRYAQLIDYTDGKRTLKGVFRARLDEPSKADRTLISWFSYDVNGNTWSPGNIVKPLVRLDGAFRIRHDLATLLAHDVQRFIEVAGEVELSDKRQVD